MTQSPAGRTATRRAGSLSIPARPARSGFWVVRSASLALLSARPGLAIWAILNPTTNIRHFRSSWSTRTPVPATGSSSTS